MKSKNHAKINKTRAVSQWLPYTGALIPTGCGIAIFYFTFFAHVFNTPAEQRAAEAASNQALSEAASRSAPIASTHTPSSLP